MERMSSPQRWDEVLVELYELAGSPGVRVVEDYARRDPDAGSLSKSTVGDLLKGKANPRRASVEAFVLGCLYYARTRRPPVVLPEGQDVSGYWMDRYDQAAGADTSRRRRVRVGATPLLADCFQDRAAEEEVTEATERVRTVVLCGMGGVGKTQIAARFAAREWEAGVDVLAWVPARSRDEVLTAYAGIAAATCGAGEETPEQAATRLLAWLASTDRRWLVVLDDLQDPSDLRGLWPPSPMIGRTLVTTRRRDAALLRADRRIIEVDVFSPDEALSYLHDKLASNQLLLSGAPELAADLGYLPLALAQAVAYLLDQDITCEQYRELWADRRRKLRQLAPEALPDDHPDTLAATWSLSIELADRLSPVGLALPVLQLACLLDSAGIPAEVFATDAFVNHLTGLLDRDIDTEDARHALRCLHKLSLAVVDRDQPTRAVRVHALIQRVTREAMLAGVIDDAAWSAADALGQVWPEVERDRDLVTALRANTEALIAVAGDSMWDPPAHPVLFRLGHSLGEAGLVTAATNHYQHLHDEATHRLGPEHPTTLAFRGNLGFWTGKAGNTADAIAQLEQLLEIMLRVFGRDHPDTLTTLHNLAFVRGEAGDVIGAATQLEGVLESRLRVLGPDHPNTLQTHNNLALWRGKTGNSAAAAAQYERLLVDQIRVLGPDHPSTLITHSNLAILHGRTGDTAGATAQLEQLLETKLSVLGSHHPDTLLTRNNLAASVLGSGDTMGAVTLFEQLLDDQIRVLGPDHPDTLITRSNLASSRGDLGDAAGAAAQLEQLVETLLRVHGPNHPNTLLVRHNLAVWLRKAGDGPGAAAQFERLLDEQLRVLGPDHPDTVKTRNNIALCQTNAPKEGACGK